MQYASAYVWHPYGYSELTGLANASFATREVALYPTPHTMLVKAHFEGALEFLDAPGEWALGEDGYVYLWPTQAGASPNSMNISAAFAPRVIDVRGASTENADVVRDITVANLSLVGSGWLRNFECEWADRMNSQPARDPTGEWAFTREGMVRIENATNITVVGCELLAAGTSAVWMEHFAQSCTISSNWIEHASFTGVHVNGYGADRKTDRKTRLLRHLYICKRSFYQDRLGTDMRKNSKKCHFVQTLTTVTFRASTTSHLQLRRTCRSATRSRTISLQIWDCMSRTAAGSIFTRPTTFSSSRTRSPGRSVTSSQPSATLLLSTRRCTA
jgi:hypothetical protein